MSFPALLITSYILVTLCSSILTISILVGKDEDFNIAIPILHGIVGTLCIIYDGIVVYIVIKTKDMLNIWVKCLICTIMGLSTIVHIVLFSLTVVMLEILLPVIYSFTILSVIIDFSTYITVYNYLIRLREFTSVDEGVRLL